jgi:hypothetical protein
MALPDYPGFTIDRDTGLEPGMLKALATWLLPPRMRLIWSVNRAPGPQRSFAGIMYFPHLIITAENGGDLSEQEKRAVPS